MITEDRTDIPLGDEKVKSEIRTSFFFRLGEIANKETGVIYFGQKRIEKDRNTALFICKCGESFRTNITSVVSGKTSSCGCKRFKNNV